ncbi:hypothetical protein Tco_0753433 [Tanacetum coccineum]
MMRLNEVHKFSDGTLTRVLEKLDQMVKDFRLFKYNPGMETRIWSEDDKRRSKEFIEVIERRLKIRIIFNSLESFVGPHGFEGSYKDEDGDTLFQQIQHSTNPLTIRLCDDIQYPTISTSGSRRLLVLVIVRNVGIVVGKNMVGLDFV